MSQGPATKSILLVEDEVLLAMTTKMVLEGSGYNVVHVSSGEAAIQAVRAGDIDLVLMDIDLGRNQMDGTEAAERILEERTIPIIFHTSHSERDMVERVKGITRYGYVLKSAGEFVLLEAIQMAFELFAANQQIEKKEERYQHMFEYNRSGVAVLKAVDDGEDFVFVDYNRRAAAIDSICKEEVIGRRVTEVFPGVEAFGILDVFREVWKTGQSKTHTDAFYQDKRISGWRESFVYRIPSGEIVSVYRDVTEEKETREKLQVAWRELECLYGVSRLIDAEGTTLSAILQGTVDLLPRCIGEAGNVHARLTVDGTEYVTADVTQSQRQERIPIFVRGEEQGALEILCDQPDPIFARGGFREGFDLFLQTLAERLGKIVERFHAVEELHERNEDFRYILESIGDAVITTDLRGRITRTNQIARELLGCTESDLQDTPLYEAFTLEDNRDGRPLPNPVETALATDKIITLSNHTRLVSRWGKELQIADSVAPVHDEKGESRGAVLVFRDETEKYEREKKLRESEERYRRLFENMAEGFIRANSRGEIVLVNQAAVELCGYDSVDDLTGRPMTDLYVDPHERSSLLSQLTKEGQLRNREFLLKQKSGDAIWTLCNIKAIYDESGDFCGTEGLFRDYTEKKTAELERAKHERFLDSVLNAIQDPVSVHDADLNIRKANRIVHAMFPGGERIIGEKCYKAYFGRSAPCDDCPILKAFATKQVHSCLKELPGSGEAKQYFELFAYPIIDDQGNVESVVEYARNVTELVRTKEQLHKMLQVLPEGFVMINVEGEIIYANEAAGRILEVHKDTITGSYYNDREWKQIDEEGNPYPLEALPLALTLREKTEAHNLVHGIVAPDGETKWLSVNSAPLLDVEGELTGAVASFRDISEQRGMETALRRNEAKLRVTDAYYNNVLQFLPVFVLDREYRYVAVNGLAADLVHMDAKDLVGKKLTDLFPGITETDFYKIYEKVMLTGNADSISAPLTLPDGTPGLYQVHVLPCSEGIQCVAVDITARQRIEDNLRRQQRYEQAIAAASAILLSAQSERKAIRKALATLREATAVSRIYLFENFDDPADGLCMRQLYEECAPGVEPEIDNPVLQHVVYNDGFSRWMEVLSSRRAISGNVKDFPEEEQAILGPQGIVSILVLPLFVNGEWRGLVGYDQTERTYSWSESESSLLQTACDLLGAYLGRIESENVIRRQLQEKELLIRETHHRIKNNFASIAGLLTLQADTSTNDDARSVLAEATGRVRAMSDLYDKMLASEDVRAVPAAPYLNELIDSIVSLFSHQTDVTVEKRIADLRLDSDSLFSLGVIVNELLTNSLKYAFVGRKRGTIRIGCETTKNRIVLVVKDDGAGLPEEFDADRSTGFGTSLVTMLAEQMGATVAFENENGTRVTVEFSAPA